MKLRAVKAYLLLGSNLGNRRQNLELALRLLSKTCTIKTRSACYETAAWGKTDQPSFYNQAVCVQTTLSATELMKEILSVEKEAGRIRAERWGPRVIDVDIIFYGDEIIDLQDQLTIPHPAMQDRKFVLVPLAEIAPELTHPILKKTISEMLKVLKNDPLHVKKLPLTSQKL